MSEKDVCVRGETVSFPSPQSFGTPLGIMPDVRAVTYYTNGKLAAVHFAGPKEYSHPAGEKPSASLPVTSLWFYESGEIKKAALSGIVSLEFRNEPLMFLQLVNGKQAAGLMWFYKSGFIREINFTFLYKKLSKYPLHLNVSHDNIYSEG